MAKAMPALAQDQQRRNEAGARHPGHEPESGPDSARFLLIKNVLFWGSIAVTCTVIYAVVSNIL